MWTIEDIEALNPEGGQSRFLRHVLRIGAASEKNLCEAAELLEQRGSPYVIGFAQLPFLVQCGESFYRVPGWREGVFFDLAFIPTPVAFTQAGQLTHVSSSAAGAPEDAKAVWLTQVTAVVSLWNKRARLHKAYFNCVSHTGFRNEIIGHVEDWMDLSEARMPLPARRYAPLTAQMFQDEVTRRIRTEIHHAVKTFLRAYRVANLEDLPSVNQMHGYFAMVAPGRLASSSPPIPIAAGLCATNRSVSIADASPERIASLLGKNTPLSNRVLGQLMAMNRLLGQGEPELALIGCVTAIEWFLNDRFADLVRRSRSGREISASISACLRSGALNFIAEGMKTKLMELALTRNAIVHGPPPARENSEVSPTRQRFVVEPMFVRDSLFLALDLYRAVNLNLGRSHDAVQHGAAPERSGEPANLVG